MQNNLKFIEVPSKFQFPAKMIPPPTEKDLWVVDNYCDYCEEEITQKQIEDGDMIIRTHHNSDNNRVYFGSHRECYVTSESKWKTLRPVNVTS